MIITIMMFLAKHCGNTFDGKRGFSMKSFWYAFDINDNDHKSVDDATDDDSDSSNDNNNDFLDKKVRKYF